MTNNKYVLDWINEMAEMTQPDKIVWIDGSEEQADVLISSRIFLLLKHSRLCRRIIQPNILHKNSSLYRVHTPFLNMKVP